MGPRARAALKRQDAFHRDRIANATTATDLLRAACSHLVAESKRGGPEALRADAASVLAMVQARRQTNLTPVPIEQAEEAA